MIMLLMMMMMVMTMMMMMMIDDGNEDEDDDDNVADDDERFQLRSVYFQLVQFSFLNPEEISRIVRISIDINLLSDDFPFKPKRHLKEPRGLIN